MTQNEAPLKIDPLLGKQSHPGHSKLGDLTKRLFDLFVSGLLLVLFSPLFLYLAWRIKRDSHGPVFYRGLRTGREGRKFHILKFRTMYEDPESYKGSQITAQGDSRVTPVGRRLRATKMNELPQLWNVFKGEMSLVGPRPEITEIVNAWPEDARQEILSIRPGITSPASVLFHDEENRLSLKKVMQVYMDDVLPSKLRLDQLYVRYRSFLGDLDVLFYTLLVLLPLFQIASPPEENLLVGPIRNLIRRNFSWFGVDMLVTFAAIGIAGLIWRSIGPLDVGLRTAIFFGIGFALLFSFVGTLFGVHRIYWSRSSIMDVLELLPPMVIALAISLLVNQFVIMKDPQDSYRAVVSIWNNEPLFPPAMILLAAGIAFTGFVLVRYRERLVTGLAARWIGWRGAVNPAQERAIIIGGGETGHYVSTLLKNGYYRNSIRVIGFVDDDLYKLDTRIGGINVIGRCRDIPGLVKSYDIGLIIFTIHKINPQMRREILQICYKTAAHTVYFPEVASALGNRTQYEYLINRYREFKDSLSPQIPLDPLQLTCSICLSQLSLPQVLEWLDKLHVAARQGDLDQVREQIEEFRSRLGAESAFAPSMKFND
jgi:lipopolysaccharide/colanic/teichoic acid biosynthesis glycosyltransferase